MHKKPRKRIRDACLVRAFADETLACMLHTKAASRIYWSVTRDCLGTGTVQILCPNPLPKPVMVSTRRAQPGARRTISPTLSSLGSNGQPSLSRCHPDALGGGISTPAVHPSDTAHKPPRSPAKRTRGNRRTQSVRISSRRGGAEGHAGCTSRRGFKGGSVR